MSGHMHVSHDLSTWRKLAMANWCDSRDPQVYGTLEVDATPLSSFQERVRRDQGVKLTVTHLVGRAVALAIARMPEVNGRFSLGRLLLRDSVDVFFQVATEGGRDLSGAKVEHADRKSAIQIAGELSTKAQRIREHHDQAFERSRRTLSRLPAPALRLALRLSDLLVNHLDLDLPSLGMPRDPFGSAMVTSVASFGLETGFAPLVPMARVPIIILVGAVEKRPAVVDDRVVVQPRLTLCATFDHRLMDGYQAGQLAGFVRRYLADPASQEPGEARRR